MKAVLALISIIVLSACVTPQQKPLDMPERFLGWWNPLSDALAGYGVQIYPDGKYEIIFSKDKTLTYRGYYRVFHSVSKDKIYIATFEPLAERYVNWFRPVDLFSIVILELEPDQFVEGGKSLKWTDSFNLTREQYETYTVEQLWQYYQNGVQDGWENSMVAHYVRPYKN